MISVEDDVALHVAHIGEGPDVVVLSGGPARVMPPNTSTDSSGAASTTWPTSASRLRVSAPGSPTRAESADPVAAHTTWQPPSRISKRSGTSSVSAPGELVPGGSFETVPRVAHNFWATDPDIWVAV